MEWQPIETAPKDGTRVDLWFDRRGRQPDCRWRERFCYRDGELSGAWTWWTSDRDVLAECTDMGENPTHWMPIPNPPIIVEYTTDPHAETKLIRL